jgi:putative two-component system response regulator
MSVTTESAHEADRLPRLRALLGEARRRTGAEAGTVFLRDGDWLRFAIAENDVFTERFGVEEAQARLTGEPLSLEERSIASFAVLTRSVVNIPDVYAIAPGRLFAFNPRFDVKNDYRTRSVLAAPLRDARGAVFGVLQLINRRGGQGDVVPFDVESEAAVRRLVEGWLRAPCR